METTEIHITIQMSAEDAKALANFSPLIPEVAIKELLTCTGLFVDEMKRYQVEYPRRNIAIVKPIQGVEA